MDGCPPPDRGTIGARVGNRGGPQACPADAESVYHLEVQDRVHVQFALAAEGISTAVQYPASLPLLPAYARFRHRPEAFPVASRVTATILSIPLYPEMTETQQRAVVTARTNVFARSNGAKMMADWLA